MPFDATMISGQPQGIAPIGITGGQSMKRARVCNPVTHVLKAIEAFKRLSLSRDCTPTGIIL